jgi:nucleoside-diphosphate-sugar epimerase
MTRRVLITGGTGFVGSHVVEAYTAAGWRVRALVRDPNRLKWLKGLDIEIAHGSLSNSDSLCAATDGCAVVVHCAGLTKSIDRSEYYRVNSGATSALIAASRSANVRRFVYCSSQAAAGSAIGKIASDEEDTPNPLTDYGRSKLEGEVRVQQESGNMEWAILRPPAVIGPRDEQFLPLFRGVVRLGLYPAFGNNDQKYSFICVHDLAKALLSAGETDHGYNAIYFVASAEALTWSRAASVIAQLAHRKVRPLNLPKSLLPIAGSVAELISKISRKPALLSRDKIKEILSAGWICSPEKIRQAWRFECKCDVEKTLTETYEFYKQAAWL